jgi:hypothetical protein
MQSQWRDVEESVSQALAALAERDAERWVDVAQLEDALQSKMEARRGGALLAVRKRCMDRCETGCHTCIAGCTGPCLRDSSA